MARTVSTEPIGFPIVLVAISLTRFSRLTWLLFALPLTVFSDGMEITLGELMAHLRHRGVAIFHSDRLLATEWLVIVEAVSLESLRGAL